MGSTFSSNVATINQQFMTSITSNNQDSCVVNNDATVTGNVIIVSGSTIGGNVGTVTGTSTDASCLMVSQMDSNINDIMKATASQANNTSTDWFNGFSWSSSANAFDLTQSVTNNINQINQVTCTANSMATDSNNYIYVSGSTVGGNVGIAVGTNAQANCSMTNMMSNYTYNNVQGDANQSNTQTGMFVAIVSAICIVIGLVIIGVVILFAVGAIGFTGYELVGNRGGAAGVAPPPDITSELADLGLTSDDINTLDSQISGSTPALSNIRAVATPTVTTAGVPASTAPSLAGAANSFLASTGNNITARANQYSAQASTAVNSAVNSKLDQAASYFASKVSPNRTTTVAAH